MREFVSSVINYTILIAIPVITIGAACVGAYKEGYDDGRIDERFNTSVCKKI